MKKIIGILLVLAAVSVLLTSCFAKDNAADGEVKFGLGVYSYYGTPTDADEDGDGECKAELTFAAVYMDKDGKIVKCMLDSTSNRLSYTSDGKALASEEYLTKRELGDAYGMTAGGASSEWYKQADIFESLVKGKSISEVRRMVSDGGKGSDEVIDAGCTISVADFVKAIERATESSVTTDASAEDEIKLGIVSLPGASYDAAEDEDGSVSCDVTVFAAMTDTEGKITACRCDAVHAEVEFNVNGEEELDDTSELKTKRELGDDYGMKAGGASKEWYEQADAFEKACIGKDMGGVTLLAEEDGYGVDSVQNAGCTVKITDFVKAAVKAIK